LTSTNMTHDALPKSRDASMIEAEQAFRLQLHRLVVDTLIVPVLGERLWISALDQNMVEDEAFSRGILMLMTEESEAVRNASSGNEDKKVGEDEEEAEEELDVVKKLDEERVIDWDLAANKLLALEHTMNPSDQLDVIKTAVDIITNSPMRLPNPPLSPAMVALQEEDEDDDDDDGDEDADHEVVVEKIAQEEGTERVGEISGPQEKTIINDNDDDGTVKKPHKPKATLPTMPPKTLEPMSADELIPAFIKVVSRAASKAAQRSAVGINDTNIVANLVPNSLTSSSSSNSSNNPSSIQPTRSISFRSVESGGLLSPSSTVCYMRALIPNDLLVSEPGFILALLEGAVAFISSQSQEQDNIDTIESHLSVSSIASSRRSSARRSSARPSFRPSDAIRERLERGLSIYNNNMMESGNNDEGVEVEVEDDGDVETFERNNHARSHDGETSNNASTNGNAAEKEDNDDDGSGGNTTVSSSSSSNLWGANSNMTVSRISRISRSSSSKRSTVSASHSTSFDVWRNSALQETYGEVDSGSSDEENHH
jgi:hypothetical protein